MIEPPRYNIKTIRELLQLVNKENVDLFLKDFSNWLKFRLEAKETPLNYRIKNQDSFIWINDGKNDFNINFIKEDNHKANDEMLRKKSFNKEKAKSFWNSEGVENREEWEKELAIILEKENYTKDEVTQLLKILIDTIEEKLGELDIKLRTIHKKD